MISAKMWFNDGPSRGSIIRAGRDLLQSALPAHADRWDHAKSALFHCQSDGCTGSARVWVGLLVIAVGTGPREKVIKCTC